ncbi:MAG: sulfite exporter TauE/SafE family protein [Mycobacterium sp.]
MSPTQSLIVLLLAGIGLAFANTLASAGSALSLPVLLAVGLGPELANGTNRVAVLAGAVAATATFIRAGKIQWPIVRPLMMVAAVGAVAGAVISEMVSPTHLHLALMGALLVALALLAIRPARWLKRGPESQPHVGPMQLVLIFLISVWAGFIVLDGMTYLLLALVLSVGFDVIAANAAKAAIAVVIASVSLVVLAAGGNVDWVAAMPLSAGAVLGGLVAARLALNPAVARWIYRLLVLIIVGEVGQLALAGMRM